MKVMEAESRVALNTPTEHVFQDEFKKWQKGTTLRVMVASTPKVCF
jgi:hypothetical protein